jgi:hypothetical protein
LGNFSGEIPVLGGVFFIGELTNAVVEMEVRLRAFDWRRTVEIRGRDNQASAIRGMVNGGM